MEKGTLPSPKYHGTQWDPRGPSHSKVNLVSVSIYTIWVFSAFTSNIFVDRIILKTQFSNSISKYCIFEKYFSKYPDLPCQEAFGTKN